MRPVVQKARHTCERCGQVSLVIPISPYEFNYRCPCGHASGCYAWAHANPPPVLEKITDPIQISLIE